MRAGQLRKRIQLQRLTRSRDATTGASTDVWATERRIWAQIKPLSAREFEQAMATESDITHTITVRYGLPIPTTEDRFVLGSRVFSLAAPPMNLEERDRWLVCKCVEAT